MMFDRYTMTTVFALAISTVCVTTIICKNTDNKDTTRTCGPQTMYVIQNLMNSHTLWLRQSPDSYGLVEGETVHTMQYEEKKYIGGFYTTRKGGAVEITAHLTTWFNNLEATEEEKRKVKEGIEQSEIKYSDESDGYTTCSCTRTTNVTKGSAKRAGMLRAFQDLPDGTIDKTVTAQVKCTTKIPYKTYKEIISKLRASN